MANDTPPTAAATYEPSPFAPFNPIHGYEPEKAQGVSGDAEVTRPLTPGTAFGPIQLPYKARTLIIDNPTNQMWFVVQAVQWVPKYTLGYIVKLNPTDTVEIKTGFPTTYTAPAPITGEQAFVRFLDTELAPSTLAVAPFSSAGGSSVSAFAVRTGLFYATPGATAEGQPALTNRLVAFPFWLPGGGTFDRIGMFVEGAGNADSSIRCGIYNDDAPGGGGVGGPGTLVIDGGNQAIGAGVGSQLAVINQTLAAGRYWLAGVVRSAVSLPTVWQHLIQDGITAGEVPFEAGFSIGATRPGVAFSQLAAGALPAAWGALVPLDDGGALTMLRAA